MARYIEPLTYRGASSRNRPSWWTQDQVLARLQSGEYVGHIVQAAVRELEAAGTPVSHRTLRSDISSWSESASWGEQFQRALAIYKHPVGSAPLAYSKRWHDEFFGAMETCDGNMGEACRMVGVGAGVILAIMDPRNKCYDAAFSERFRIAEAERVSRIRDSYLEYAENGQDHRVKASVQKDILQSHLPALHSTKHQVDVSGSVKHLHAHGVVSQLPQEVVTASQNRMKALMAGRRSVTAEHSEDVVDAVVVSES